MELVNAPNTGSKPPGPLSISMYGLKNMPVYLLPGNHDDREHFFKCLFPNSPPQALMNGTFMHKGMQFICLDWGPNPKASASPEMLRFLAQALETGFPTLIIMHHTPVPIGCRWLDAFIADDLSGFWEIVTGRNISGIFCGHVHATYEKVVNNIPIFGLRSTAPQFVLQDKPLACLLPPHYRLVTVKDGNLSTQIFEVPL
jgi:3',5'-cyclic-AMP phosphodiesterase